MIKLVVFDMAGTTVDEQNLVYRTVHQSIVAAGYDATLEMVLEHGAGKEKSTAIHDVLEYLNGKAPSTQEVQMIFQRFKSQLKTAYEVEPIRPQPSTEFVFQKLRENDVHVALNTGYSRPTALQLLGRLKWEPGREIDTLVTASDVERGRPYPDMIFKAMGELSIEDSRQVIKIGDSAIDVEEGKKAKCKYSIGVTTGAQTAEQIQKAAPDYILDRLEELLPILGF